MTSVQSKADQIKPIMRYSTNSLLPKIHIYLLYTLYFSINNIEKSQQDTRDYRGLQLENGLKVLLVSDPTTDVSAAALSVQVG